MYNSITAKLLIVFITLIVAGGASSQPVMGTNTEPKIKLLVLGDSLSAAYGMSLEEGWVALLSEQMSDELMVVNASVSGETSGGGLARLPALLERHRPDWVLIELGANDGLRGYPLSRLRDNLTAKIALVRNSKAEPLLFAMALPANYGERYTRQFAQLYPELAEQYQLGLLPFQFSDLLGQTAMIQEDGLHPTAKAQPIIAQRVADALRDLL